MKTTNHLIAEALGAALFLSACGGGGGGGSTTATPSTPASVDVTVTPSLGKFSTGCSVELRTGTGALLGSAPITDAGNAFIRVTGYSGPVIAQVKGASGCTYFDEATASQVPFGAGRSLSAVSDSLRVDQGINVLTHLAASRVLDGDKLAAGETADTVKLENLTIQRMFQVADMFAAPTLVGHASDQLDSSAAGQLAAQLAALSELAHTRATDVATLAAALGADIADGTLDTVGASDYQSALQASVSKLASSSAQATLLALSRNTVLIPSTSAVQSDVQKVISAGTSLQQARTLFADLRTSVLALSNSAGTGTLDAEKTLLQSDFQHGLGVDILIDGVKFMLESASLFFDSGTSQPGSTHSGWVGTCRQDTATQATCHISGVDDGTLYTSYEVRLTKAGAGAATWAFTQTYTYQNGQSGQAAAPTGMTGSFTYSPTAATARGQFIPMTGDAERSAIDIALGFTATGTAGAVKYSASGTGNSVKADGTSTLKVDLTKLDLDPVTQTNQMVLTLTGPRHRFDGALTLSGRVTTADGSIGQPRFLKFAGTFTDTASHYTVLDGTVTASQDWTGYDPRVANSDSNYARYAFTFDGVANKGPGAAGITLSFSGDNQAGPHAQKISLRFTSASGIVVTGSGVQTPARPEDLWNWTFANENGIKARYAQSTRSGSVTAADGSELGTLSSQRVSFVDGSFESLM